MTNCKNTTDGWVSRSRLPVPPAAPCVDASPQCPTWAAQGLCIYTPEKMLATCPVSCGSCDALPPPQCSAEFCKTTFDDSAWRSVEVPHDWSYVLSISVSVSLSVSLSLYLSLSLSLLLFTRLFIVLNHITSLSLSLGIRNKQTNKQTKNMKHRSEDLPERSEDMSTPVVECRNGTWR